jgi:hypothetical protein
MRAQLRLRLHLSAAALGFGMSRRAQEVLRRIASTICQGGDRQAHDRWSVCRIEARRKRVRVNPINPLFMPLVFQALAS